MNHIESVALATARFHAPLPHFVPHWREQDNTNLCKDSKWEIHASYVFRDEFTRS